MSRAPRIANLPHVEAPVPPAANEWPMSPQEARDVAMLSQQIAALTAQRGAVAAMACARLGLAVGAIKGADIDGCVWKT